MTHTSSRGARARGRPAARDAGENVFFLNIPSCVSERSEELSRAHRSAELRRRKILWM